MAPTLDVLVLFYTPEVAKIVLPKVQLNFKDMPNRTRWPKELNQKSFPPRNI